MRELTYVREVEGLEREFGEKRERFGDFGRVVGLGEGWGGGQQQPVEEGRGGGNGRRGDERRPDFIDRRGDTNRDEMRGDTRPAGDDRRR